MNNYHRGRFAEFIARWYMVLHGYRIISRNYITGRGSTAGEIDFIAKRGHCIIFVEVKQRQDLDSASYAISPTQQKRLIRGAQSFMQRHPQYQKYDIRFDAVFIAFPCHIRHIKNAWLAEIL